MLLDPQPDCKGIFDPLTIQPGFVIDALEIWVNEKFANDDAFQMDSRLRRRGRKPENFVRSRFHGEDGSGEGGFHQGREDFQESQEGRIEPPEKRQMVQPPTQHGPPPRPMDESVRMRHPPPHFRGRPPSGSDNFAQFRPGAPFHAQPRPQGDSMRPLNRGSDESEFTDASWSDPQGHNSVNRRGMMQGSRGRGRGFAHSQMSRDATKSRDGQYFHEEEGNKIAQEQNRDQNWQGGLITDTDDKNVDGSEAESEWNDPNYIPQQRRGPHPLLLRGHHATGPRRFSAPIEARGMSFDGSGRPPMRQSIPQRGALHRHPLREGQEGFHLSEQPRPPNGRSLQKLRGLMDGISRPAKEPWQGDRTGGGR